MSERRHGDEDLKRNEDPEAIGGAVGGATGGAMIAGLALAPLGPLGGLLGALAGAAGGWWAGRELVASVEELDRVDERLSGVHEAVEPDRSWREVRHAYQVGWLAGRNPRYAAHGFGEADVELRAAWVQAHLHDEEPVPWEDVRERARAGWRLARDGS